MATEELAAGATSIMYGEIDSNGALSVQFFKDPKAILRPEEIAALIKNQPKGLPVQEEPFWCSVDGPHRLVYRLNVPNWYFPCFREMQQGKWPWVLNSQDPERFYGRPQFMSERNIFGGEDKRIKTIFVDYNGGYQTIPYLFDLHVNIWQDPNNPLSFKTPVVIDPGSSGGRTEP